MQDQIFDQGVLCISLDFELLWGSFDSGRHRKFIRHFARNGGPFHGTRSIVARLLALFEKYDVRVTWATLGHLFLDHCESVDGVRHPEMPRPNHAWFPQDWYCYDPAKDFRTEPLWYGRDMVEMILNARPKHEVASHSFSHVIFSDAGCTPEVAEAEVRKCVELAEALNLKLDSFVFPRNQLGHLDTLRRHGFRFTRGKMPFWFANLRPRTLRRAGHVLDDFFAITPVNGLPKKSDCGLWILPVWMFLQSMDGARRLIPARSRISKATKGIERAIRDRSLFHLSFHPTENLCFQTDLMFHVLEKILAHAAHRRDEGALQVMTMSDVGRHCEMQVE
jgi:peptidoglycan/xylan/chitin deacetylase (PgdA/CDA1 family)